MSLTIEREESKNLQTGFLDRRFSLNGWTLAVLLTLGVAFLIRFWGLGLVPGALHPDELAGYTGVLDELTHRAPLRAFFDYRIMYLPLYGIFEYFTSLFFGNSAMAFRFPAVVFGVLTVFCTYGFTRSLTRDRVIALLAAAIMAILPWDVVVSRVGWEPAAMLPFILGGLWSLDSGLRKRDFRLVLLAGFLFGAGSYSYRAALPDNAVLVSALVLYRLKDSRRSWRAILVMAGVWTAVLLPLIFSVANDPDFFWRDKHISTFADGVNAKSLALFARNYLEHFDPNALFRAGDGNANHGPSFGVLYVWMFPWIVFAAIATWRRYGAGLTLFLLVWAVLYPLGGALTNDGVPHFLRTLIGAPLACILTAIGIAVAWDVLSRTRIAPYRREIALIFCAIILAQFVLFCRAYFILYVAPSADANQFENREVFDIVRSLEPQASRVCFPTINGMNSLTLFSYYLRRSKLQVIEGMPFDCERPRSIVVTNNKLDVPPKARLVATAQNYEGRTVDYIYMTGP